MTLQRQRRTRSQRNRAVGFGAEVSVGSDAPGPSRRKLHRRVAERLGAEIGTEILLLGQTQCGSMSMAVLERTGEIGVMRAMGIVASVLGARLPALRASSIQPVLAMRARR